MQRRHRKWSLASGCLLALLFCAAAHAQPHAACVQLALNGEAKAGQSWSAPIGQGWVFRLQPIEGNYSGWDLVVDRDPAAGYPDALLLATPPYSSINEREVGTTYGLRAQDALGWNPRSFHFLTDTTQFALARRLFPAATRVSGSGSSTAARSQAMQQLSEIVRHAAPGEFRIVDARIISGSADAAPYAENWGIASARTPHSDEAPPPGGASPRGSLEWIRFSIALRLPATWKAPPGAQTAKAPCR